MKRNPLPSAKYLWSLFTYERRTGVLRWKVDRGNKKVGDVAGAVRPSGHIQVGVDFKLYRAHLIIWVMMTGREPPDEIDHKDMNKSNNRWGNLRPATRAQNAANRGASKRNTSGLKGAVYYKAYDKWAAQIWKDKRQYFLGYFNTREEAHAAYMAKARELYGDYARAK